VVTQVKPRAITLRGEELFEPGVAPMDGKVPSTEATVAR
jgi:hypothetical protein